MEITQSSGTEPRTSVSQTSTSQEISSDFETFLRMLTVQMQNQDPLNPVDSSDYAVQLATFSQVEQSVLTNDLLKSLSAQMTSNGLAGLANWVGKEARAEAPAYFDGEPIILSPKLAVGADQAELIVRDKNGVDVQRLNIPISTTDSVEWAGVASDGTPFPEGLYSFEVVSTTAGEIIAEDPLDIYSVVTEVRTENGETMLILQGGAVVPASQVTALRNPA